MVLMCLGSIELVWDGKLKKKKKGENTHSGHFRVMCTGTP